VAQVCTLERHLQHEALLVIVHRLHGHRLHQLSGLQGGCAHRLASCVVQISGVSLMIPKAKGKSRPCYFHKHKVQTRSTVLAQSFIFPLLTHNCQSMYEKTARSCTTSGGNNKERPSPRGSLSPTTRIVE